jgi:hypothetical protein
MHSLGEVAYEPSPGSAFTELELFHQQSLRL